MTHNTQFNSDQNFKKNIADLTKIPPKEFEKYFQDWMERDDVARTLQAKLRCDLIKNFNKTNLGKHILSHTMSSTGGSTMRLTLSPLVLALNTLVAEFLYAQNCHFTLSVFCTEVPFRNTLPDFESMREFRFNEPEITEIYEAVTGHKAVKKDLHKHIIHNYETNPNMSLLLLIIKFLLQKESSEQLSRNVEVQTDIQEKYHKSTLIQAKEQGTQSSSQDDNLRHINKYLQTLSEKLCEMTNEFEEFTRQKQNHESRSRDLKSVRSREYYALNKSLERIAENMKKLDQTKQKNKRLVNIIKSIDGLTKEFGKCAKNFNNVIKIFSSKERNRKTVQVKLIDQQTETEVQEKTYAEWIHEMRNTENGRKFLNRVEVSLRKILNKQREDIENQTEIRIKHIRSIIKLHYQQKFSKHFLQDSKINLEEAFKFNENIEKKLLEFELKQNELLLKLYQASMESREAQQKDKQMSLSTVKDSNTEEPRLLEKETEKQQKEVDTQTENDEQDERILTLIEDIKENKLHKSVDSTSQSHQPSQETNSHRDNDVKRKPDLSVPLLEDAQRQFLDLAKNIARQGRSVDNIIYDAKLRIQQLENESNQLEQNFQSYLERRKQIQRYEQNANNPQENLSATSSLGRAISLTRVHKRNSISYEDLEDEEIDEEFRRMKEHLRLDEHYDENGPKSNKSDSSASSLEVRNAILEAKLKFFEHEQTIRQCVEQDDQIRSGNLLQKQFEKYSELNEVNEYFNNNFGKHESDVSLPVSANREENKETEFVSDTKNSELKYDIAKDEGLCDIQDSLLQVNMALPNADENTVMSARRELFPQKEQRIMEKPSDVQLQVRYHEPIAMHSKSITAALKFQMKSALNLPATERTKPVVQAENSAELIKQSMTKMQRLFEEQTQSKEELREIVNDIDKQTEIDKPTLQNVSEAQLSNQVPSTRLASEVTKTTPTPIPSDENLMDNILNINPISSISVSSILNLTSESEESIDLPKTELDITANTIIDMSAAKESDKEQEEIVVLCTSNEQEESDETNETSQSNELNLLQSPSVEKITHDMMSTSTSKQQEEVVEIEATSDSASETNSLKEHATEVTPITSDEQFKKCGHTIDSPKLFDVNSSEPDNDKEIGEIFSASDESFGPISIQSDYIFAMSTGNKKSGEEIDDSESEFWA